MDLAEKERLDKNEDWMLALSVVLFLLIAVLIWFRAYREMTTSYLDALWPLMAINWMFTARNWRKACRSWQKLYYKTRPGL